MTSITPTADVLELQGIVHGGQQPVSGATIQLIVPGTTGYGSAGTALASTTTSPTTGTSHSLSRSPLAVRPTAVSSTWWLREEIPEQERIPHSRRRQFWAHAVV